MVLFQFCRTQLAYLSLARLLARLETSQECLVRGTRRRARERQPKTPGPSVVLGGTLCRTYPQSLNALSATLHEELGSSSDEAGADGSVRGTPRGAQERQPSPRAPVPRDFAK